MSSDFLPISIGINSNTVQHLFNLVKNSEVYSKRSIKIKDIEWVFLYFYQYMSLQSCSSIAKVSMRTFSVHINETISILADLITKILEDPSFSKLTTTDFIEHDGIKYSSVAVDTTIIKIQRPTIGFQQKHTYSGKHGFNGFKYEAAINVNNGRLVHWFCQGYGGSIHDKKISDDTKVALKFELPIMGDKAYVGAKNIITPHKGRNLTVEKRIFNNFINSHRVGVENFFLRLKRFKILSTTFRSDFESLDRISSIIAYSIDYELGEKFKHTEKNKSVNPI